MRTLHFFLLSVYMLLTTNYVYGQITSFSKFYDVKTKPISVQQFGTDSYLFEGINTNSSTKYLTIGVINLDGNLLWKRNFDTDYPFNLLHQVAAITDDSTFMFAMPVTDDGTKYLTVLKMNKKGNVLFKKNIQRNFDDYLGIIKRNNDEFAAAILTDKTLSLLLLDNNGNVKTEFTYTIAMASNYIKIFSLINFPDGGMIISNFKTILKLDNSYNEVWNKYRQGVISLANADENNFVAILGTPSFPSFNSTPLIKYDEDGNIVWQKNIFPYTGKVLYHPDGYYFYPDHKLGTFYYDLTKLDENGDSISSTQVRDYTTAINICRDGSLLIAGNIPRSFMWLSKTNTQGELKSVDFEDFRYYSKYIFIYNNMPIYWYSGSIHAVDIDYSTDAGKSWIKIAKNLTTPPPYNWSVPFTPSDKCLFKVSNSSSPSVYDLSDSLYTIIFYKAYDYVAANNILMWIGNNGDGSHDPKTDGNGFYWPGGINNTGESAIFEDGLLWGGKVNGEIRVNGSAHRQGIKPGIILPDGSPSDPFDSKYRLYKIKKGWSSLSDSSIDKKVLKYNYENWAGDIGAEYNDVNGDGLYTNGFDAPVFSGDEVLYYAANDLDTTASRFTYGSDPIGLEFHTTIFAFNTNDALANAVFKKYEIINKSGNPIEELYLTYWADDDLGDANDDYVGCDSTLNLGYTYNATNNAGIYNSPPPAVGHMLLQGPKVASSQNDSAFCNKKWMKGFKNLNISSFTPNFKSSAFNLTRDASQGNYRGTIEFYNLMQCKTNDGRDIINPQTQQPAKFPLAGNPETGEGWYEGDGWSGSLPPADRRHQINLGPFTMAPGDTQEVVYAIFIARGLSNLNSVTKLKENAAFIKDKFYKNFPDFEDEIYTIPKINFELFQNYPNPFNSSTKIRFSVPFDDDGTPIKKSITIKIYDILGREIKTIVNNKYAPGNYEVDFNGNTLASGVYFYRIEAGSFFQTKKMVLLR